MVNPATHEALFELGNIYRAWGQPDSARRYLESAIEVRPKHVPSLVLLGEIAISQQHLPEAQDYFERAARIQPDNVDARVGLGWTALLSGRIEEAAMTWRPVIRFTEDPTTVKRMVDLYRVRGDQAAEEDAVMRYRQLSSGEGGGP
jgi:cytochrome c-type biogenesis protein CcmH/NrfG